MYAIRLALILYTALSNGHLFLYSRNLPEFLLCYLLQPELRVPFCVTNQLVNRTYGIIYNVHLLSQ